MIALTTDFHTHILPGIDDGSSSVEESIKMLKLEMQQGVQTVCLTPHFNGNTMYPKDFLAARHQSLQKLNTALKGKKCLPNLVLGAEVQFCIGMSKWEQLKDLSLGDTGYILIEMPSYLWNKGVYRELELIYHEQGLTPILAHIERYFNSFTMNKTLRMLSTLPVLLQCNSDFFLSKKTQRIAIKLLNDQRIHLLGSDCHSPTWRSPDLKKARECIENHADKHVLSYLANIEHAVLNSEEIIIDNFNT